MAAWPRFDECSLQAALARHHAGQFAEAEQIYRQILEVAPNHADARHLLGLIAHQTGRSELAVECIRQAIALNPNCEGYYLNLGGIYLDVGRLDESDCLLSPGPRNESRILLRRITIWARHCACRASSTNRWPAVARRSV